MITTPEIICDLFSFLDKDQIERIQFVNHFWNNIIIHHTNILPLRQFKCLHYSPNQIRLYATKEDIDKDLVSYIIAKRGKNLSNNVSSRYSQLTFDEVLNNLNDVVFDSIQIKHRESDNHPNYDNYIIVDQLNLCYSYRLDSYIRKVCANPKIVQLPSTPKEIQLRYLKFKENEKVLNFTGNSKLNGANRLTIHVDISVTNIGNFIRQWFELYLTHKNPISLVGKFELTRHVGLVSDSVLDAVKTFLNNTQLCVKYSLETKEFRHYDLSFPQSFNRPYDISFTQRFIRRCVLYETDSYALVIEMAYNGVTDEVYISSINASDLDRPSCYNLASISFCVKPL